MKKVAIVLGIPVLLVFVLGLYAYFLGPQTMAIFVHKKPPEEAPALYAVPVPMEVTPGCSAKGEPLAYLGWKFVAPWKRIEKADSREVLARITFNSGQTIVLTGKPQDSAGLPAKTPGSDESVTESTEALETALGLGTIESYEFNKHVLDATPESLSLFMPREEALRLATLLTLKSIMVPNLGYPLYSFESGTARGFQIGSPGTDRILLMVFGPAEQRIDVMLAMEKQATGNITQEDVNCLIRSLRPSPAGS